jgi:autoinducer 2-degrading protein
MIATLVHIWVKPEYREAFVEATIENHQNSIREKGNLRFDVLQDADDPLKFTLYEAYETELAAADHKKTEHYLKWRETVENMMAQPRKGIKHEIIKPQDSALW